MQRSTRYGTGAAGSMLVVALVVLSPTATAADRPDGWPETPTLDGVHAIPEYELATMRGRFMGDGNVVRFGLRMVSRLQSGTGKSLQGGFQLDVDMTNGRPLVSFVPSMSIEDNATTTSAGSGIPHGDGAETGRVIREAAGNGDTEGTKGRGVVQQVQVAGDGNRANNQMRIEVVERISNSTSRAHGSKTDATLHGADGASVRVGAGQDGMTVSLDLPGSGHVTQRVAAGRGVEQLIALKGALNHASSAARLRVELRDSFSQSGKSMRGAIESLRTLR